LRFEVPVTPPRFVLASASPRRTALLVQIGLAPDAVEAAAIDETPRASETPAAHAVRLAEEKARAVAARAPGAFVLGADTVVACGRRILGKPATEDEARRCVALLSGRRHRVFGGIAVVTPAGKYASRHVETAVLFKRLTRDEIDDYIASGEWRDKAGGYAIQGLAARFARGIVGSYSNVVGLPLYETVSLLVGQGYTPAARFGR
jgi:nucleoside triphosphate pyrophosphatase